VGVGVTSHDAWLVEGPMMQCDCGEWHGAAVDCHACAGREQAAEREGAEAHADGDGEVDCPHWDGVLREAWLRGWRWEDARC